MTRAEKRYLEETALAFTLYAWGWLEVRLAVPALPTIWVMPALFAAFGMTLPAVSRRYAGVAP